VALVTENIKILLRSRPTAVAQVKSWWTKMWRKKTHPNIYKTL